MIVEDPANYLKYYLGYLQFLDLQQEVRELAGDAFHLHSFHQKVLCRPLPVPDSETMDTHSI